VIAGQRRKAAVAASAMHAWRTRVDPRALAPGA